MDQYYVLSRGKILGPFDIDRIKIMRQRGRIGRADKVSTDKKNWLPFDELNESDTRRSGGDAPAASDARGATGGSSAAARAGAAKASTQWYFQKGDKHSGPIAFNVLQGMARGGKLEEETLVWQEGTADWVKAGTVGGLFDNAAFKGREENGVENKQKPSGGFWGLFRRKKKEEEVSPHLASLQELSSRLHAVNFGLDDLVFIDSRHQQFLLTGQGENGDAKLTLGMLTLIAYQTRATDIHFEPTADGCDARVRVDGTLVPVVKLPKTVSNRVAGVVKVLCEIDFAGARGIQEGSYSATAPDRRTDFRVSFTPAVHGQKLAIRILDMGNSLQSVDDLGAPKLVSSKLQSVMRQESGMILMCGPTGSGKTTTLYSLIHGIDRKSRNVMTIEDPVEYQIEGVTQSSVDARHGKNFSDMLRALLRQDPDVLLVGEIRDAETAKIAMQATMTGHLVLSTVHAQDTISTIPRLIDLSADPKMVASALDLVLAQRLVRTLCQQCAKRRRPSKDELRKIGRHARDTIHESAGCDQCLGTGFFGRRAIFELLATDERLKDIILRSPTPRQLREALEGSGFVSLREHGQMLVAQGITTLSEIDRVASA